jgi:ElaA protein
MAVVWHKKRFNELSVQELYSILALRIEVFVIEQNCPYQDADGKDIHSLHVFATDETGRCVACSRIVDPGISYVEVSIGRFVTALSHRRLGLGKELMEHSLECVETAFGPVSIRISAQSYLKSFYSSFGFVQVSEEYLEDDIPHIEMLRTHEAR